MELLPTHQRQTVACTNALNIHVGMHACVFQGISSSVPFPLQLSDDYIGRAQVPLAKVRQAGTDTVKVCMYGVALMHSGMRPCSMWMLVSESISFY